MITIIVVIIFFWSVISVVNYMLFALYKKKRGGELNKKFYTILAQMWT